MPVTIASNERSFCQTNIVKTHSLNAFKNEFFQLIQSVVESDLIATVNLEKMAIEWCQMKNRRVKIAITLLLVHFCGLCLHDNIRTKHTYVYFKIKLAISTS